MTDHLAEARLALAAVFDDDAAKNLAGVADALILAQAHLLALSPMFANPKGRTGLRIMVAQKLGTRLETLAAGEGARIVNHVQPVMSDEAELQAAVLGVTTKE